MRSDSTRSPGFNPLDSAPTTPVPITNSAPGIRSNARRAVCAARRCPIPWPTTANSLPADLGAEAMQAVEREQRTILLAALEGRDLALERIEEKNQSRDLILIYPRTRLSERADTIKIVPVFFTDRGGAV